MQKFNIKYMVILLAAGFLIFSCSKNENKEKRSSENEMKSEVVETKPVETVTESKTMTPAPEPEPEEREIKVTFIELGSVKCIPCRMMQPIMKEIEEEYKAQVKVIFYDVWTAEGRPYAEKYRIRVIPTQVFLDKDGNEYFRHEGFFPKERLVQVLKMQGVE